MVSTLSPERNFRELASYIWFASLIGLGGVVAFALFQFALPRPQFVNLGPVAQFQTDHPVYLARHKSGQAFFLWVVNLDDGIHLFDARSTHPISSFHNCIVEWVQDSQPWQTERFYFADPCIGGAWNLDGTYRWGPAPRDLDWFVTDIRNGELWMDVMNPMEGESWLERQ